jgi:hypothetical protein
MALRLSVPSNEYRVTRKKSASRATLKHLHEKLEAGLAEMTSINKSKFINKSYLLSQEGKTHQAIDWCRQHKHATKRAFVGAAELHVESQ